MPISEGTEGIDFRCVFGTVNLAPTLEVVFIVEHFIIQNMSLCQLKYNLWLKYGRDEKCSSQSTEKKAVVNFDQ